VTDDCNHISGNKGAKPPRSRQAEEEEEFFDLIGKEHVDRPTTPEDVRSLVERIKARSKARWIPSHPGAGADCGSPCEAGCRARL
jgi:hypothetical protein